MCCVGILLSVGFFRINKSVVIRVLLVLNIALEIFYIAFSDSRTGQLCLCVGAALYVLLVVLQKKKRLGCLLRADRFNNCFYYSGRN